MSIQAKVTTESGDTIASFGMDYAAARCRERLISGKWEKLDQARRCELIADYMADDVRQAIRGHLMLFDWLVP